MPAASALSRAATSDAARTTAHKFADEIIFRLGGGNSEQIAISNCLIYETYGCPIKIRMGRGGPRRTAAVGRLRKSANGH